MAATLQLTAYEVAGSVDLQANTSQLYVQLQIITTLGTYNHAGDTTGTITVNGQTYSLDGLAVDRNTTTTLYEQTHTVSHSPDGSKTVTVAAVFDPNTPATGELTQTLTVVLTSIPRASTVAATDAAIGSASIIAVSRKSDSYTHTLAWRFGSLSGYLNAQGGFSQTPVQLTAQSLGFPLPEAFYYQIPDSPTGLCTLVCTTYLGDTPVGQSQSAQFTVTADPSLCGPQAAFDLRDTNPATLALTGDESSLVRYCSNVACTLVAEPLFGASIAQASIQGIPGDSLELAAFAGDRVDYTVTDSRGYSRLGGKVWRPVEYVPLTANLSCGRTDPTSGRAQVVVRGNYYDGGFGAQANSLTILCQVGDQTQALTPVLEGSTYEAVGEFAGLDYRSSHMVTVTVSDKLGSHTLTATVGKGIPVFHWGEEDFSFQVPVSVPEPTADSHAVNRGYAVAKAGDTMTGPLTVPQLLARADGFPGMQMYSADGALMGTVAASQIHGRVYIANNRGTGYETFFLPEMTPGRADGATFELLSTKTAVTVAQGGTGAADAAAARWNLGIRCDSLLAASLSTVGAQQTLAAGYKGYLVVGSPGSASSLVTQFIPTALLTQSPVRYQLADNLNYCAFELWLAGDTPAIRKAAGTGSITALFGIN